MLDEPTEAAPAFAAVLAAERGNVVAAVGASLAALAAGDPVTIEQRRRRMLARDP